MEALADFGAVNLLGYRALTDAIYRVWYGAFDQAAALQLATVLVVVGAEPGRARAAAARPRALHPGARPRRRRPPAPPARPPPAGSRPPCHGLLLLVVVALPWRNSSAWAVTSLADGASAHVARALAINSLLLATLAAVVAVVAATVVAYGARARPSRRGRPPCG